MLQAIEYVKNKRCVWDVMCTANGALAGLAAVTGGCALVDYSAAIAIGVIGGWSCMLGSYLNAHYFGVDDPVDAVAVHAWAGGWGVFAVG
jgi:Amt family ammonium transporter